MSAASALGARALRAVAHVELRAHQARRVIEGVLLEALDPREKSALSIHLYDKSAAYRGTRVEAWEESWWRAALPPVSATSPKSVIVLAAGAGREALWLLEHRYRVTAYEPAPSMAALARRRVGDRACVHTLDFAGFIAAPPQPVDAIIIGWGALSHAGTHAERLALLAACRAVCPRGPILCSWLGADPGSSSGPLADRAQALGRVLGRALARLRGRDPGAPEPGETISSHLGTSHLFRNEEIVALGEAIGRRAHIDLEPYPHATYPPGTLRSSTRPARAPTSIVDPGLELFVDVLRSGRAQTLTARGGSMGEAIPHGSRVRIVPCERSAAPRLGDVVAARAADGGLLIHRIVGVDSQRHVLLRGDTSPRPDGWFRLDQLLGVAALEHGAVPARVLAPQRSLARRAAGALYRALNRAKPRRVR